MQYAKQHDLSLTSLYAFKRTLLKKGVLHSPENAFAKLSVSPSSSVVNDPQILARFPNGVVLEIINVTPSLFIVTDGLMIQFKTDVPVYLHRDVVDFRKQINGLSLIVQESMALNVFSEAFFVFVNRPRTRIKILYWQRNAFCLWMKRLERDKFSWPKQIQKDLIRISTQELHWLLEGFDIWQQPTHQTLHFTAV